MLSSQLNAEDGGHRKIYHGAASGKKCDEASEAYKAGYKNICEIGKERIRRAGDKIKSEHPDAKLGHRLPRIPRGREQYGRRLLPPGGADADDAGRHGVEHRRIGQIWIFFMPVCSTGAWKLAYRIRRR